MLVLALDTTARDGSVALLDNDRVVEERRGDVSRTHGERLPAEIVELLAAHGRHVSDVELFAVASGPGSFTGLRIGIATMQGLALVGRRPIVGVAALDALASMARRDVAGGERIGVWMDARRREVFAALYDTAGGLNEIEGATVGDPSATLMRWKRIDCLPAAMIGDGATLYAGTIEREAEGVRVLPPPLLAAAIGRLALERASHGDAVHPAGVQPLYVRRPDAELARDHALADRAADVARSD